MVTKGAGLKGRKSKPRSKDGDAAALLRAVIARARNRGYGTGERQRAYEFRTGLQRVFLKARTLGERPAAFFAAIAATSQTERSRFARQPIGDDYLHQLLIERALPLDAEIAWVTARLSYRKAELNRYLASARTIEARLIKDDPAAALRALDDVEAALGTSIWSTSLRIALLQQTQGTEVQKDYVKQIRTLTGNVFRPFLANYYSQRCEPTVSIGWFLDDAKRRLDRLPKTDISEYLRYKLLGRRPRDAVAAATALRMEQNHHDIDVYETLLDVLQYVVTSDAPAAVLAAARHACMQLHLDDPRLTKLTDALDGTITPSLSVRNTAIADVIFSDGNRHTVPDAFPILRAQRQGPVTAQSIFEWGLLASTSAKAHHRRSTSTAFAQVSSIGLAATLTRSAAEGDLGAHRAADEVRKLAHVFQGLPIPKAILQIASACAAKSYRNARRLLTASALNCSEYGLLDLMGHSDLKAAPALRARFQAGRATEFSEALSGDGNPSSLPPELKAYAIAARNFLDGEFDAAARVLSEHPTPSSTVLRAHQALLALNVYARTGDVDRASELISSEHVVHRISAANLPIALVYGGLEWRDLAAAARSVELSNALALIPSTANDDKLRTYRRFAIETLLMAHDIGRPSEFRSVEYLHQSAHLVFFLSNVCTPTMLDMLPTLASTREVLEERREICGFLMNIDREGVVKHEQEVLEISRELTIQDGLRNIDGSRVHVDVDALTNVTKKDLHETFIRYSALAQSGDSSQEGFLAVLKELSRRDPSEKLVLSMTSSEADELLVSMITRTRERFLFDVPHGLDSYLSKRIRHGSIVGYIRAPAEREGVIAKRHMDGSYKREGTWADRVSDPIQQVELQDTIQHFSRSLDAYLTRLKDVLLHVKSEAKPLGMLDVPLTAPTFLIIRSVAHGETTIEGFVQVLFKSLWGLLNPSLIQVRNLLNGEAVRFVSDQAQLMRARAQTILKSSDDRADFDAAAGAASASLQAAFRTAAGWFEPVDSKPHTYTLDEVVHIAIASVNAVTQNFVPRMDIESDAELLFSENSLPVICDILYIAFGNIAEHANAGSEPVVWLSVNHQADAGLLHIKVSNEVGVDDRADELQNRLAEIRGELETSHGQGVVREGKSGMHKIWSIVGQSDDGKLDFRLDNQRFDLEINVPFSVMESFQVGD